MHLKWGALCIPCSRIGITSSISFRISVWPHKLLVSRRSSVRVQVAWGLLNPPLTGKPIPPISIHTLESRQCANFGKFRGDFTAEEDAKRYSCHNYTNRYHWTGHTLIILLPWFNYYTGLISSLQCTGSPLPTGEHRISEERLPGVSSSPFSAHHPIRIRKGLFSYLVTPFLSFWFNCKRKGFN